MRFDDAVSYILGKCCACVDLKGWTEALTRDKEEEEKKRERGQGERERERERGVGMQRRVRLQTKLLGASVLVDQRHCRVEASASQQISYFGGVHQTVTTIPEIVKVEDFLNL
jgi:hypothetical protein